MRKEVVLIFFIGTPTSSEIFAPNKPSTEKFMHKKEHMQVCNKVPLKISNNS